MCRVQEKELAGEVTIGIYTQSRFRRKTGGWSCQHILSRNNSNAQTHATEYNVLKKSSQSSH